MIAPGANPINEISSIKLRWIWALGLVENFEQTIRVVETECSIKLLWKNNYRMDSWLVENFSVANQKVVKITKHKIYSKIFIGPAPGVKSNPKCKKSPNLIILLTFNNLLFWKQNGADRFHDVIFTTFSHDFWTASEDVQKYPQLQTV